MTRQAFNAKNLGFDESAVDQQTPSLNIVFRASIGNRDDQMTNRMAKMRYNTSSTHNIV